jgi:hypothetical protein
MATKKTIRRKSMRPVKIIKRIRLTQNDLDRIHAFQKSLTEFVSLEISEHATILAAIRRGLKAFESEGVSHSSL